MSNDLRKALLTLTSLPQTPIAKQGRPIDPHSTQPDLPFLFESLQQGQVSNPSQAAQPAAPAQPAPPMQPATQRCPRCQAELPQSATFCPRCGNSLRGNLPTNSQGATPVQSQNKASQPKNPPQTRLASDIAEERTMHYTPLQEQSRTAGRSTPPLPGAAPSTPAERTMPTMARPGSSSAQQTSSNASPASTAPRPFLQTISPSVLQQGKPESRAVPSQSPATGTPVLQQQVYPTHPANQTNQANPLRQANQPIDSQKVLFLLILTFLVILIVVVILLFAHHGGQAAIAPIAAGACFYTTQLKGLTDERSLSLRAAPPAAHRDAGVW